MDIKKIINDIKNVVIQDEVSKNIIINRRLVCDSCEFFKSNKCTRCSCPNAGNIYNINSRCPINQWEDGWGDININTIPKSQLTTEIKPTIVYFDEDSSSWISEEMYKEKFPFF